MNTGEKPLIVGKISGVYGVKGWVKVYSHTAPKENIFSYKTLLAKKADGWQAFKLANGRPQGKGLVARIEGVDDRNAAEAWVGTEIGIDRQQLPNLDDGEYYWADLVGLKVITTDGVELGKVSHLLETGSNDVMSVKGDRERLVPFILEQFVKSVNIGDGEIIVEWDPDF